MALNINASAAQKAEQEKIAAQSKRQVDLQPKTVVEKLQEQGPNTLKASQEMRDVAAVTPNQVLGRQEPTSFRLPANRSGSPINIQKQLEESKLKTPALLEKTSIEKEEQRILPIIEVSPQATEFGDIANDSFGAAIQRADKFTSLFHDKGGVGGAYLSEPETMTSLRGDSVVEGEKINPLSTKGILFDENGFNAGTISMNERNQAITQVDPLFARLMGIVTERFLGGVLLTATPDDRGGFDPDNPFVTEKIMSEKEGRDEDSLSDDDGTIKRGIGNSELGREIFKEWKRTQNALQGKDTDAYTEDAVSNDQFEIVGTLAKEM